MVKYRRALTRPQKVPGYLRRKYDKHDRYLKSLLRDGRIAEAIIYSTHLLDENFFDRYLDWKADSDGRLNVTVHGNPMYVDVNDTGISREIYITREHERFATAAFRNALSELADSRSKPVTALEIGTNIGYFALVEASELETATIYAAEPVPRNRALAESNMARNGFDDRFDLSEVALSDNDGTAELHVTATSNQPSLFDDLSEHENVDKSIPVETLTVDTFIERNGIDPDEICLIRMDVEGHEGAIFDGGLGPLLQEIPDPLVLFIELHPAYLSDRKCQHMLDLFERRFDFVGGYQHDRKGRLTDDFGSLGEFRERMPQWGELVLTSI